jgi:hypothetical protein
VDIWAAVGSFAELRMTLQKQKREQGQGKNKGGRSPTSAKYCGRCGAPESSRGDAAEALFEAEERLLQAEVADGGKDDGEGEGNGFAEEVAAEAGILMGDEVVADEEAEDVEYIESEGDASEVGKRA